MIDTILFDLDGTLIDTNEVIIESFDKTFKHFLNKEVSRERITEFFGEPLTITMEREFNGLDINEVLAWYRAYQKEHAEELIKEFSGIKEMLDDLKLMGLKMVIVTSRTRSTSINYLNMFNMLDYFMGLVSCDDLNVSKPNPEPIYKGIEIAGTSKENAIMVGDGFFDIKCANNADVKSVLVGWRITKEFNSLVGSSKVDYEIETPMDLVKLIKDLNA